MNDSRFLPIKVKLVAKGYVYISTARNAFNEYRGEFWRKGEEMYLINFIEQTAFKHSNQYLSGREEYSLLINSL